MTIYDTREGTRLFLNRERKGHWNRWGPFLAERAWGTVREDYSANGDAWNCFSHDQARSRAYRWNEDGIAGICDRHQYLCFALALWNGRDPILKERLFGLTSSEGNHGEDVKEYYFYLDSTPTHSYMKCLYKYPQGPYPYEELCAENRRRTKRDREYELVDTGVFDQSRYFDVIVEYAKAQPEDLLIRISISNRGPEAAPIDVLPTLWFRNTWSWGRDGRRPAISAAVTPTQQKSQIPTLAAKHWELGDYLLYCSGADELIFTENETNYERFFKVPSQSRYLKDAFHVYVVERKHEAINPAATGTKAAARYSRTLDAGATIHLDLRLSSASSARPPETCFADFEAVLKERKEEADEFYNVVLPPKLAADEKLVARQAFAGMLWSRQYYHYIVTDWLEGDPGQPTPPPQRLEGRNHDWTHLFTRDVISMPDKWEFPWFASWDLGFHCITLAHVDPQFAKQQILLMLREWTMHPNGQVPAYEWDFGDVNPPILSLAAKAVFDIERRRTGVADHAFMERIFQKMLLNFTWWVNRKDALGKNIFQGGFLGMDNIGAFDRDHLPPGYLLGQADGTSWMAAFAKSMLSIALLLAEKDPVYEDVASKFWEHFIYIANAMNSQTDPHRSLWDEKDGFFYDYLISAAHERIPVRARTMVGFVPMFGASTVPRDTFERYPDFQRRRQWFIKHRPDLIESVEPMVVPGANNTLILGLVRPDQLRRMLVYMLDENEFFSPYGVRAVSRYHRDHPLILTLGGQEYRLDYEPGESTTNLFGGNSNWRGPIWMPVNFLILHALEQYHLYYGDGFKIECPTGSGQLKTLDQVAGELARRLARLFLLDAEGRRAVFGDCKLFNSDPHWRDLIPFHEYFHGDSGRGCGASHQTGWTGLIAQILISLGEATTASRA
ncbi:MAG TPA: glucosidase [Candidatus Binatia bacterium]|nr:glucosidase [Candidatus Binatia bacterium]